MLVVSFRFTAHSSQLLQYIVIIFGMWTQICFGHRPKDSWLCQHDVIPVQHRNQNNFQDSPHKLFQR
jgi:hypothetical protein